MAETLLQSFVTLASVVFAGLSAKAALDAVRETRASGKEALEKNRIAEGQRQALIRPHVVIYVRPGKTHSEFRSPRLYVHNVGPGAARHVQFKVIKGGDFLMPGNKRVDEWGVFTKGLTVLPPDDALTTAFAPGGTDPLSLPEILIEVQYRDIEGKSYEAERFPIGTDFLLNTIGPIRTTNSNDPDQRMARSLEEIAKKFI